jgi:hypothetical protein
MTGGWGIVVISAAALVVSIFAVFFAAKRQAGIAQTQSAVSIYHDYLRMCVEYPMFASYEAAKRIDGFPSLSNLEDAVTPDSERYLWFVSFMLSACDNIIYSDDYDANDWERAILAQIEYHEAPLARLWPEHWEHEYSPRLRKLISEKMPKLARQAMRLEAAE